MSDGEGQGGGGGDEEKKFFADRDKMGRATCRKCKQKLEKGALRIAKSAPNPFGSGFMKLWHHVPCMFEVFAKQRPTTARINGPDDVAGWDALSEEDQQAILQHLPEGSAMPAKPKASPAKVKASPAKPKVSPGKKGDTPASTYSAAEAAGLQSAQPTPEQRNHKDNSFKEFRRLCAEIANVSAYGDKTAAVKKFFTHGATGEGHFKGDLLLWVRLLLPGVVKRVYNVQSKQLIKLFSRILQTDQDEMLEDLEKGDVADTISTFFERSTHLQPTKKSTLSLYDVDEFLEKLSTMTKEDEQSYHFKQIAKRCTSNDLKMIIRLVKSDLRINAGAKHILEAVHPDAYQAFQTSRDIASVIARVTVKELAQSGASGSSNKGSSATGLAISVSLMTPVLPMLAEACKSVQQAMNKCPNGMYSEIKYDGERVQVHKKGNEFKYFSRSLKAVMPHKVSHFKDYIPQAFPCGEDLILDSEILMIDTSSGKPLPFGTLGRHKKEGLTNANVCLFVFDCIYYNGETLLSKPIKDRRKILHSVMKEIPNRVMLSEVEEVHEPKELETMIEKVFRLGLEGLVLKDLMSTYEPGKRHWLKVKKDYLFGGAMADSADLVVLGAWFGTGQKGGMMSVFLMGCHDPFRDRWCTVTKVHTGHDDKTLETLQNELGGLMVKISRDMSRLPKWLTCTKTMVPDFVAKDPKLMPVWEITGAEFTSHEVHTADGISIRFPRVTRIRDDKDWKTATSLPELKKLYKKSKDSSDFSLQPFSSEQSTTNPVSSSVDVKKSPQKNKKGKKLFIKELDNETIQKVENSLSPFGAQEVEYSQRHKEMKHKNAKLESNESEEGSNTSSPKNKAASSSHSKRKSKELEDSETDEESRGKSSKREKQEKSQEDEDNRKKIFLRAPAKPLPDYLAGLKAFVIPGAKDERLLKRYIVAYGGELVGSPKQSTHVIHEKKTSRAMHGGNGVHVTSSWLWNSVRLGSMQPAEPYRVVWKPEGGRGE